MKNKKLTIVLIIVFLLNYIWSFKYISSKETIIANNTISKRVNPIGRVAGLKLYTNGVLVIGMSKIELNDGMYAMPYENTGIKEGDIIKSINGIELNNVSELISIVNNSNGNEISIKYERDNEEIYTTIKPVKSIEGNYMLGIWVRDAAAGVGTITFYDRETNRFAALGHGIEDVDTGNLLNISNGELVTSKIITIVRGEKNKPGEIRCTIDEGEEIGIVEKNTNIGVYGYATNNNYLNKVLLNEVEVASRSEIKIGKATIMCQLKNDEINEFEVEIKKIYKNNYKDNKSMLIKVSDNNLIEKTGGIIPGMSGTPIIQNGKLIGAITNVLLNDPTQGYAIFSDMMF
ncbi:MAG: SpoIVB peptidase [Clostridia bacterium]|nr:SpoIVB peptidase [Clostridia bacterium]